jgi:hypothetical protein
LGLRATCTIRSGPFRITFQLSTFPSTFFFNLHQFFFLSFQGKMENEISICPQLAAEQTCNQPKPRDNGKDNSHCLKAGLESSLGWGGEAWLRRERRKELAHERDSFSHYESVAAPAANNAWEERMGREHYIDQREPLFDEYEDLMSLAWNEAIKQGAACVSTCVALLVLFNPDSFSELYPEFLSEEHIYAVYTKTQHFNYRDIGPQVPIWPLPF